MTWFRKPVVWVALIAVVLVGCRGRELWSGAEFVGGSLRLVAAQPVCGCLMLANVTAEPVLLRSDLNGVIRGAAVLKAREMRRFRFDWAGARPDDMYWIHGADPSGFDVDLRETVHMEAGPSACDAESCIFDTLLLNKAVEGR